MSTPARAAAEAAMQKLPAGLHPLLLWLLTGQMSALDVGKTPRRAA